MSVQRVVERLQQLGMSGYEAKAYVALISADRPVNGYEVAKRSGVPRSTVYETLSKLVGRGAAYEVKGPDASTDYLPLPPAHLLDRMQREFDESLDDLRIALPEVEAPAQVHLIHNLKGKDEVLARASNVIAGAKRELFVSIWPEESETLKPLVDEASRRRVEVSMMSFGPVANPVGHTFEHKYSAPEVVLENLGCRLLVVVADRGAAIIGGFLNGEAWGVFTDNPAVVLVAVEYVRHDIAMHILADRMPADGVDEYWRDEPELRRLRDDKGSAGQALRKPATAR